MSDPSPRSDAPGGFVGGVLVIGYGNALRTDDGVGWHAARLLAGDPRIAGAIVRAVHQLAPEMALDMSTASLVVLVDAATDAAPGAVVVRRVEPGAVAGAGATSHQVDPGVLLVLARDLYGAAPDAYVVSVGVADMGLGETLSPPVAAALPAVADAVVRLVDAHLAGHGAGAAPDGPLTVDLPGSSRPAAGPARA